MTNKDDEKKMDDMDKYIWKPTDLVIVKTS